jgi:REP element-mobilizing transposase RayT
MGPLSPNRLDHRPPDWLRVEPDYFITVCAEPRGVNHFCKSSVGPVILESVKYRNEKQIWFCHVVVLMPDHIHLLLSFPTVPSFASIVGNWKHWLSRQHAISWQENFLIIAYGMAKTSDRKPSTSSKIRFVPG